MCSAFLGSNANACRCDGILSFCQDIAPDTKIIEAEVTITRINNNRF